MLTGYGCCIHQCSCCIAAVVIKTTNQYHFLPNVQLLFCCFKATTMSRRYSTTTGIHKFRQRGAEILRIEALSDAVFAFAVSLLAVSLEVPQHFHELQVILKGGLPFFATV